MTYPTSPITPPDPPEFEQAKVAAVGKETDKARAEKKLQETRKKALLPWAVNMILESGMQILFPREKRSIALVDETNLSKNLRDFKNSLSILKERDESQNSHYIQHLTEAWNKLVIDYESIMKSHSTVLKTKFSAFIEEVKDYPPQEEHSLGFYLSHYAGEEWLPFPFMEILKRLHENHLENQNNSDLSHLLNNINEILKVLNPMLNIQNESNQN